MHAHSSQFTVLEILPIKLAVYSAIPTYPSIIIHTIGKHKQHMYKADQPMRIHSQRKRYFSKHLRLIYPSTLKQGADD